MGLWSIISRVVLWFQALGYVPEALYAGGGKGQGGDWRVLEVETRHHKGKVKIKGTGLKTHHST